MIYTSKPVAKPKEMSKDEKIQNYVMILQYVFSCCLKNSNVGIRLFDSLKNRNISTLFKIIQTSTKTFSKNILIIYIHNPLHYQEVHHEIN